MSKIVTIPNCSNPFVVIVNGVEYSYPAGQTVEVPDFIAAVIENHVNSHPQPAPPEPGVPSGPSVQPDFNQTDDTQPDFIKNKTHGYVLGDTLDWDGNTDGRLLWDGAGIPLYHVSDSLPSLEDLSDGFKVYASGMSFELTYDYVFEALPGFVACEDFLFVIVGPELAGTTIEDNGFVLQFPDKSGVYFPSIPEDFTTTRLTIPGYTDFVGVKKIDSKYLPAPNPHVFYINRSAGRIYNDIDANDEATKQQVYDSVNGNGAKFFVGRDVIVYPTINFSGSAASLTYFLPGSSSSQTACTKENF